MLENATTRRVLPTLWGIRRKDFIEDKLGCCVLLRDIGTCKTVIQRYENLALPNSLRLIPQHFPVFFVALRFPILIISPEQIGLAENSPLSQEWLKFKEFLTGWFKTKVDVSPLNPCKTSFQPKPASIQIPVKNQ
jgi:hypothetical protein